MCEVIVVETGFRKPVQDCSCYQAVMRTFRHMSDEPQQIALQAALRVYRHHHPEDAKADALITVQRWVADQHIH
jgi:hypothetical protein